MKKKIKMKKGSEIRVYVRVLYLKEGCRPERRRRKVNMRGAEGGTEDQKQGR